MTGHLIRGQLPIGGCSELPRGHAQETVIKSPGPFWPITHRGIFRIVTWSRGREMVVADDASKYCMTRKPAKAPLWGYRHGTTAYILERVTFS